MKKKELVFLQFHLNETDQDFSAIDYLLFSSFQEFINRYVKGWWTCNSIELASTAILVQERYFGWKVREAFMMILFIKREKKKKEFWIISVGLSCLRLLISPFRKWIEDTSSDRKCPSAVLQPFAAALSRSFEVFTVLLLSSIVGDQEVGCTWQCDNEGH